MDTVLHHFLRHFGIDRGRPARTVLTDVLRAFAHLPYENLTKILADAERGSDALRQPEEVIADHARWGTGGTCFSLTAALRHLVRELGFEAEPLLADRPYGPATHCALRIEIDGEPYLVDPGYLLVEPVPLQLAGEQRVATSFNDVALIPNDRRLELHTVSSGRSTLRYTLAPEPVDWAEFVHAWRTSFSWEMMRYPVVTGVLGGRHVYVQGRRVQTRTRDSVEKRYLNHEAVPAELYALFGIDLSLAGRVLDLLHHRGESLGET